jgi:type VI secretion system protein ImpH
MASQSGRSAFDLKLDLLREGHAFSFYQAIRVLKILARASEGKSAIPRQGYDDFIRIRPQLSLAFPAADIHRIEENKDSIPRFVMTATLLGLYGSSSPLPTFYTEDLMDEASEDESVSREFVDIFNHRLFLLLFEAWMKYRPFLQIVEEKNTRVLNRLFSLVGLFQEELQEDVPDAFGLLRYIGLLGQYPRSAVGLRCVLRDALGEVPVQVVSCIFRKAKIPEDQRLCLGTTNCKLAENAFLGHEIDDRMGKIRLHVGPLKAAEFQRMLPGGKDFDKISFLTNFYMVDPLEYDIELVLDEGEAQPICLGETEWSRLGLDTWLFVKHQGLGEVSVTFIPEEMQ